MSFVFLKLESDYFSMFGKGDFVRAFDFIDFWLEVIY